MGGEFNVHVDINVRDMLLLVRSDFSDCSNCNN